MSGPVYAGEETVSKLNGEEFAVRIKNTVLDDRTFSCTFRNAVNKDVVFIATPEVLQSDNDILAVVRVTPEQMVNFPDAVEWLFIQTAPPGLPETLVKARWRVQE